MKSLPKSLLAAGLAATLTLTAAPAYAQSSAPESETNTTTDTANESGSSMSAAGIGALVGTGVAALGAAAATLGPAPVVDPAKIQQAFTSPALAPYAVAFAAGLLGIGAVIGTMISNAVG